MGEENLNLLSAFIGSLVIIILIIIYFWNSSKMSAMIKELETAENELEEIKKQYESEFGKFKKKMNP